MSQFNPYPIFSFSRNHVPPKNCSSRNYSLIVNAMSSCGVQCISSIILVGFLWGATNPLLRYASKHSEIEVDSDRNERFLKVVPKFFKSFLNWRFSIPFAINQSGSIMFNALIVQFPVTLVVPCVNAIQFIATVMVGQAMGERIEASSVNQKIGMILSMIAIIGMLSSE